MLMSALIPGRDNEVTFQLLANDKNVLLAYIHKSVKTGPYLKSFVPISFV